MRKPLRADDIITAKQVPASHYTAELYMPKHTQANQMTFEQVKRGLCQKSGGNPQVCVTCPAPCIIGKRLLELMGGENDANT